MIRIKPTSRTVFVFVIAGCLALLTASCSGTRCPQKPAKPSRFNTISGIDRIPSLPPIRVDSGDIKRIDVSPENRPERKTIYREINVLNRKDLGGGEKLKSVD